MSETFTKLFHSITESTIWSEDNETRIVWITMLALADQYGYVGASVPGLASRANVKVPAVRKALEKFLSPDPDSRSPEYEGRRIEVTDRGWNILNYGRFRDMRDEEVRKEYERNRKREQRAKAKEPVPDSPAMSQIVPQCLPQSAQAEAEAEVDTEEEAERERERAKRPQPSPVFTPPTPTVKTEGLINGAEMRRHGQHAWCDHVRALCVPAALHEQFQKNGLKSDADLKAWYQATVASVEGKPVGGLFEFWRVSFENWVGVPVKKAATGYLSKGDKVKQAVEGAIRIANARQQQN